MTETPTIALLLQRHGRIVLAASGALLTGLVVLTALGVIGFDTAAGVLCGALVGGAAAAFGAARGLRRAPVGRHAQARGRQEDAAALDRLEPLDRKRS